MTNLIVWALVLCGLIYILTEAVIFQPVRRALTAGLSPTSKLTTLVYCPSCAGFWLSTGLRIFGFQIFQADDLIVLDIDSFAVSAVEVIAQGAAGTAVGAIWLSFRRDTNNIEMMFKLEQADRMTPAQRRVFFGPLFDVPLQETHDAAQPQEARPAESERARSAGLDQRSGSDEHGADDSEE